jgi:putative ABC transport system substrate-binding protein
MIGRREFITLLGGAAAAWPLAARAQQTTMPVVGFFSIGALGIFADHLPAFRAGLKTEGFEEGRNVAFDSRWLGTGHDRGAAAAAELVAHRADVIVVTTTAVSAAKAATTRIPIVAVFGGDPVKAGFVATLNRPEANLTGVSLLTFSLGQKRFELLRELVPSTKLIAVLVNPNQPDPDAKNDAAGVEAAARAVGQQILMLNASNERDIDFAFETMVKQGAGALLVMADPFFFSRHEQLVALAARHAIPAIYEWRQIAQAGGLMSYGSSLPDAARNLGTYVGRILKGAKPADLPVQQAVKIELVLNLKTAKTLGLTVPITLLGRADEVIE